MQNHEIRGHILAITTTLGLHVFAQDWVATGKHHLHQQVSTRKTVPPGVKIAPLQHKQHCIGSVNVSVKWDMYVFLSSSLRSHYVCTCLCVHACL